MKTAKIYEYSNGQGGVSYSDIHVCGFDGRGCWELEVEIPEWMSAYHNDAGEILIEDKDGVRWLLRELLVHGKGDAPVIALPSMDESVRYISLRVLSRRERSTAIPVQGM